MLCSWPLLHTGSALSKCTAVTIVQAYSIPLNQLKVGLRLYFSFGEPAAFTFLHVSCDMDTSLVAWH